MKIRINKLEDSLQLKELECAEKDAALECLETEQIVMKEEMVKAKDDMKIKDELNETNLGKINSLESTVRERSDRVDIMEPLVNKMMHEIKQLKTSQKSGKDEKPNEDNDVKKMKQE